MAGLAILCSGQGRQDADMFERLRKYPEALALEQQIRAAGLLPEGANDPSRIFQNQLAQPLICLYQAMAWAVIAPELPEIELFAGYSLGELSAYACAGMLKTEDLLRLATLRGKVMSAAAKQAQVMLAVLGLNAQQLELIARDSGAFPAIRNGARHLIFGMPLDRLDPFREAVLAAGATRVVQLPVTIAAHTPLLAQAAADFREELEKVQVYPAVAPVLSGISTKRVYDREGMLDALSGQIQQTIDWQGCQEAALACGCRVFLELGPGNSLVRMLHEEYPEVEARSLSEFHDLKAAAQWASSKTF